jgi:hypothetical protein
MVEVKSIRGTDSFLKDPLFNAVFNGKGRFAIGEDDPVPPALQPFA